MLFWILLAIGAVIVVFAIVVAVQAGDFRIARSTKIAAPAAAAFAQVNDFHNWDSWSPWAKIDPNMKTTYEGPPAGTGAIYTWSGDNKVGAGRMTITESRPVELVKIKLEFFRPFAATNTAEFTFKPEGNQTLVSWSMSGQKNFMMKAVHLFMNMDKVLGGEFDKGLAQMKSVAEAATKT